MPDAAIKSPQTTGADIYRDLLLYREEIADLQADALDDKSSPPSEATTDFSETIAMALASTAANAQRLMTARTVEADAIAAVTSAWTVLQSRVVNAGGLAKAIGVELLAEIEALGKVLDDAVDPRDSADALEEVFEAGDATAQKLQDILDSRSVNLDLGEGVVLPDELKSGPLFNVEARTGGLANTPTIVIRYERQLSQEARASLQRTLRGEMLGHIRSDAGVSALGAPKPPDANTIVCDILFATNRDPTGPGTFGYGRAPACSYGRAQVSVPNWRKRADAPRPWRILGVQIGKENADRHIVLVDKPKLMDQKKFVDAVAAHADKNATFLFVHGFNTAFESGLYRTAQVAVDLDIEGPVLHYSWPSRGKTSATWYNYDDVSVQASKQHFIDFLTLILKDAGVKSLNVIAHSKGNQLVLDALDQIARSGTPLSATHLVLASPDVDVNVATARLQVFPSMFQSVTLYANAYDRPLWISGGKARRIRAGTLLTDGWPMIVPNVYSIDANKSDFELLGLNHDAYMDAPALMYDIEALFKRNEPVPELRSPTIRRVATARGDYFKVADGAR